jgi:AcrR family transcriptional regulator
MELPASVADERAARGAGPADGARERLLDAAEALFAERGFAATSMRAVTRAAGLSVSAANYHFGSKRVLLLAAVARRLEPLNRERIAAIERVVSEAGGQQLEAEDILRAFLLPLLVSPPDRRVQYRAIVSRLYTEPPELVAELKRELFSKLTECVIDALRRALPEFDRNDIAMAFQITVGVMLHFVSSQMDSAPGIAPGGRPSEAELAETMPAFCAAGMRAYLERARESR